MSRTCLAGGQWGGMGLGVEFGPGRDSWAQLSVLECTLRHLCWLGTSGKPSAAACLSALAHSICQSWGRLCLGHLRPHLLLLLPVPRLGPEPG